MLHYSFSFRKICPGSRQYLVVVGSIDNKIEIRVRGANNYSTIIFTQQDEWLTKHVNELNEHEVETERTTSEKV